MGLDSFLSSFLTSAFSFSSFLTSVFTVLEAALGAAGLARGLDDELPPPKSSSSESAFFTAFFLAGFFLRHKGKHHILCTTAGAAFLLQFGLFLAFKPRFGKVRSVRDGYLEITPKKFRSFLQEREILVKYFGSRKLTNRPSLVSTISNDIRPKCVPDNFLLALLVISDILFIKIVCAFSLNKIISDEVGLEFMDGLFSGRPTPEVRSFTKIGLPVLATGGKRVIVV